MTGCEAPTPPDSDNDLEPPNDTIPPSPTVSEDPLDTGMMDEPEQPELEIGRQKARAAVSQLHPPEMLAKWCTGLKKANIKVVENIRNHYAVPPGTQLWQVMFHVKDI